VCGPKADKQCTTSWIIWICTAFFAGSYSIPSQLRQSYVFVECRQRLLALAGLIRQKLLKTGFKKASGVHCGEPAGFFEYCSYYRSMGPNQEPAHIIGP